MISVNKELLQYHRSPDQAVTGKYGKVLSLLTKPCRVLEVGCHTGFFTRVLRDRHHEITGVDCDQSAVKYALGQGLPVIFADIEKPEFFSGFKERFDVILLMDVLEHTRDPRKVLESLKEILVPQGCLIITVPNIAYWAVRFHIMGGKFERMDAGILDKTHLQFYTRKTFRDLLENAGYRITILSSADTMIPFEQWWKKIPGLRESMSLLREALVRFFPEMFSISFLIEAKLQ